MQGYSHDEHDSRTLILSSSSTSQTGPLFSASGLQNGFDPERTQQMLWHLPGEPRLRVTQGGKRQDWQPWSSLAGGVCAVALLLAVLLHWPHHARPSAVPMQTAARASVPASHPLVSAAPYPPATYGYAYPSRAAAWPRVQPYAPGYGPAFTSSYTLSSAAGARQAAVWPAAPTAGSLSTPHYSY